MRVTFCTESRLKICKPSALLPSVQQGKGPKAAEKRDTAEQMTGPYAFNGVDLAPLQLDSQGSRKTPFPILCRSQLRGRLKAPANPFSVALANGAWSNHCAKVVGTGLKPE